jgi:hypothetical protein
MHPTLYLRTLLHKTSDSHVLTRTTPILHNGFEFYRLQHEVVAAKYLMRRLHRNIRYVESGRQVSKSRDRS